MALLTKEVKLNGILGDFYQFSLGTLVVGDDSTVLPKGFYILKAWDSASTGLPTSAGATGSDISAGDAFYSDGTLVPLTTDSMYPIVIINKTDITTWSLEGSADIGTATTFSDIRTSNIQRQLVGLVTLSGSMTGVNTVTVSDAEGWTLNAFFPITVIDNEDSATLYESDNNNKYGLFVTNKDNQNQTVPLAFMIAPFQFSATNASGDPTSADGTPVAGEFVIASDSEVNLSYIVAHNTDSLEELRLAQ